VVRQVALTLYSHSVLAMLLLVKLAAEQKENCANVVMPTWRRMPYVRDRESSGRLFKRGACMRSCLDPYVDWDTWPL
jgi:hypothetical protein